MIIVGAAVHAYRSRGLAAAWLLLAVNELLKVAVMGSSLRDSTFVFYSNSILALIGLAFAVGLWGYFAALAKTKPLAAGQI